MHTLLLLAAGCGTVSNLPFAEDAAFTDAMPADDRTTVSIEDEPTTTAASAARASAEPILRQYAITYGVGVNRYLLQILAYPDAVRKLAPSSRDEDSRGWGPYQQGDVSIEANIHRTGEGRFDWYFTANDLTILAGTHYAGQTVKTGDGAFVWDLTKVAEVTGEAYGGTLTCDYDNRSGVDLIVAVEDFTEDGVVFSSWDTAYARVNDEGDFQFRTLSDLDGDGTEEELSIRNRWLGDDGGRGDAVVTGGSLGSYVFHWTQCWDGDQTLTYQWDDAAYTEQSGDVGDCLFEDFAEVDRI